MYDSNDVSEKMEEAIETGKLETVLKTASELGVDLKAEWVTTAAKAMSCNFIELLKYLQQELKIDYSEEIGKLSFYDLEELADILEVVFALAEANGHSKEDLLSAYREKHEMRGGFSSRIFLISKQ